MCSPTSVSSCNDDPAISSLAGTCISGIAGFLCVCNQGYELNPATGRCRTPLTVACFVTTPQGQCGWFLVDGGPAPGGLCGTLTLSPGCGCAAADGGYFAQCTGACPPTDGGTTRVCGGLNCGVIHCSFGARCVRDGVCQ